MLNKLSAVLSAIGFLLAFSFYWLFNKEKAKRISAERKDKLVTKKEEVLEEAKKGHEELKKQGPEAVADDTDRILLSK